MKKVLNLLLLVALFTACDDGDLTQEDISFEDITATQSCTNNNIIYKLKDQEALILEIPKTNFTTDLTAANDTIELDISLTANRVVYRFYDGIVSTANICETIVPATPVITDQWVATAGKIRIVTTATKTSDDTNNSTKITGYNHNIVLTNVTFAKSSGNQVYVEFPFGDYKTSITSLPFNFDQTLEKCTATNEVYNYNTSEALILNIDPALIANEVTPLNTPRTGLIGTTTNVLTYRSFSNSGTPLTGAYFCQATTPVTPTLNQQWNGVAGVSGATGIIEVTTTTNGANSYKHTIVLKKVSLQKGIVNFTLGDNYILGELFTTD